MNLSVDNILIATANIVAMKIIKLTLSKYFEVIVSINLAELHYLN